VKTIHDLTPEQKLHLSTQPSVGSFDDERIRGIFGRTSVGSDANRIAQKWPLLYQELKEKAKEMDLL